MRKILRILLLLTTVLFAGCKKDVLEKITKSVAASNNQSLKTLRVNTDIPVVGISALSTYPTWDASNAIDSNSFTSWSSARHLSSNGVEFIQIYFSGVNVVIYVKLTPRCNFTFLRAVRYISSVLTEHYFSIFSTNVIPLRA